MKKKFFAGIAALVIIVVAAYNVNHGLKATYISDITLTKLEALAQNEGEWICSICGNNIDNCTCSFGVTCDGYAPDCPPPYYNKGRCWFPDIKPSGNMYCNWTGNGYDICCWYLWP